MISSEGGIAQFLPTDVTNFEAELSPNIRITEHQFLKWSFRFLWHGATNFKRWPMLYDFRKRWPSLKRWLLYSYFRERWPSLKTLIFAKGGQVWKGGLRTLIFAKGGQVTKKVANVIRFSRKVANVVQFLQKVAKSVIRWPMLYDFRERWPSQ